MAGAKPTSDHLFRPPMLFLTRGSRYKAYADLRESKLRLKSTPNQLQFPPKVTRVGNRNSNSNTTTLPENKFKIPVNRRKVLSALTQSVPDFSPVLRKENRRPALPTVTEKSATPPAKSSLRLYEIDAKLMGSKSTVSREKRNVNGGMVAARRSCVNMEELKKFSVSAANAINGENRGGRGGGNRGGGRSTVLGFRQYY